MRFIVECIIVFGLIAFAANKKGESDGPPSALRAARYKVMALFFCPRFSCCPPSVSSGPGAADQAPDGQEERTARPGAAARRQRVGKLREIIVTRNYQSLKPGMSRGESSKESGPGAGAGG